MAKFQHDAHITGSTFLRDDHILLTLAAPSIAKSAKPGQFVTLEIPDDQSRLLRRPFSILRVTPDGEVHLLIKIVGPGTRRFAALRPGHVVNILGPLGEGVFHIDPARQNTLLVAGGIGVAPLLFVTQTLPPATLSHTEVLLGGRSAGDLLLLEDFAEVGVSVHRVTEDGSAGRQGLVTDELNSRLAKLDGAATQILTCGPLPMLRAVATLAAQNAVPCQVSLETVMACGVGSCRGCVVPVPEAYCAEGIDYLRVCHEGPVFDATHIRWEDLA